MADARAENLGPAEHVLNALLAHTDHLYHNRPGLVIADGRTSIGVRWVPVTHKEEDGKKIVYELVKQGRKTVRVRRGELWADKSVRENLRKVGEYREPGLFPEVAKWMYGKVAEVWKMDNEFSARWASYAFMQEHRDMKVVLAAFMLVQSRKGDPVRDGDEVFSDDDYRDVGEAMVLLRRDKRDLNPKQILRVREVLAMPAVVDMNRELGFGRSTRNVFYGRFDLAVTKWLRYREQNPGMLEGLVKAGFSRSVIKLAKSVHYKPETMKFFEVLRWKQKQSKDGRRGMAIGAAVADAECWDGLGEVEICKIIESTKPDWKRAVGLLPREVGVTRAIMACAIESGCLSDKDLIIQTPTLEALGLLKVQSVKDRWDQAIQKAEDARAANIARNVRSKEAKEKLQDAADTAVRKAVEEVVKGMRIYVAVDVSGSMEDAIEEAKRYLGKFLQGFPLDRLHVAKFNTSAREVKITRASAAGVTQAFRGVSAGGGTDYGSAVRCLSQFKPEADEDTLFIFIGDEKAGNFSEAVTASGLNPMAFGLLKVVAPQFINWYPHIKAVQHTAAELGIPCFMIDEQTFDDPYAIPRTVRNLVAATPVGIATAAAPVRARKTLVDTILDTDLLDKPAWAA